MHPLYLCGILLTHCTRRHIFHTLLLRFKKCVNCSLLSAKLMFIMVKKQKKTIFVQYAIPKITFLNTSSFEEELIVTYMGTGEVRMVCCVLPVNRGNPQLVDNRRCMSETCLELRSEPWLWGAWLTLRRVRAVVGHALRRCGDAEQNGRSAEQWTGRCQDAVVVIVL